MQLEQKRADEKVERDKLNKVYLELIEQQRTYYKSVRDFQEVSSIFGPDGRTKILHRSQILIPEPRVDVYE